MSNTGRGSGGYHFGAVLLFVLLHLAVVAALFVPATPSLLVWLVATYSVLVFYHCTFAINSPAHLFGSRRFDTPDHSRNNWPLALITFGEGWHNNHHFSMGSCRLGIRWWEIDISYGVLKVLAIAGIVRDLRPSRIPTPRAQEAA